MHDGGPKSWRLGRTLPTQVVDMHSFDLLQLVNFIAEHYMWGSKQYISLWRALDEISRGPSIEIKTDEQLLEWFELNKEKGNVYINAQINDFEGPLQFSPTKRRCHPSIRNRVPTNETNTAERATSRNKKERATKSKAKGAHHDEGVGVDEEGIYSDTDSLVAASDSSYDSDFGCII